MGRLIFLIFLTCTCVTPKSFATYPTYYSHFYKGLAVLAGQTDTIRGYILLQPSLYKDTIPLPFDKYYDYRGRIIIYVIDSFQAKMKPIIVRKEQLLFARLFYNILYPNPSDTTMVWSLNYAFGVRSHKEREELIKSGVIRESYTDFQTFSYNNETLLLRKLTLGKVMVYDDFLNPEKSITNGFQLSNFLTPIYSSLFGRHRIFIIAENNAECIPAHFSFHFERERFVLKYVNKRYQTHFKRRDFANNKQMFEYISEHG
ncbi:MAG TPA: hypothetical protein VMT76_16895 [Puia sp.]|nr:hypothetical protein [Puia sp.]